MIADVLGKVPKEGENPLEWIRNNLGEAVQALGLRPGISYFSPHDFQGGWVKYVRISDRHTVDRMACNAILRIWDPRYDRILVKVSEKK
jgi:hypothetical protein